MPRLSLAACIAALAWLFSVGNVFAEDAEECAPAERSHCAGQAYRAELVASERRVEIKLKRLIAVLLDETDEAANVRDLPSKQSMAALNLAWQGYVKAYCDTYWYLWPGATSWKAAESVNCQAKAYQKYEVFLDRLQACVAARTDAVDSVCHLASCTPFSCESQRR